MRKKILIAFMLLSFILQGSFIFASPGKNKIFSDESAKRLEKYEKDVKEKVIDYLKESALDPNFGGEVFADFYKFGRHENKLFIWAYVCEYCQKNGELKLGSARSGPMIIFFSQEGNIKDHWEPRPGKDYPQSIRDKFPQEYQNVVFSFQTKHEDILNDLEASVKKKGRKEKRVKEKNDIILSPGEIKSIKLDANRTTGYQWFYSIKDKNIIKVISDEYIEQKHKEGIVGAGGERILEIKGLKRGATTIEFRYNQKWQPEKVAKTKEIKVEVREKSQKSFDIPDNLDAEYISARDWEVNVFDNKDEYPQKFDIAEGQVNCKEISAKSSLPARIIKRKIGSRKYCIEASSEGAAGSVYKKYTYATVKSGSLITVSFTARYPQCVNYAEPRRSECENELKEFDFDNIVHRVVESVVF